MPTNPDLQIELDVPDGCASLTLTDTTGNSPASPNGYGASGGVAINDVDDVTITATYSLLGTTLAYVFEVTNGVITAATLAIGGGTPTNILASLTSTAWPFTTAFDLYGSYGVTLPEFTDDVVSVEYVISGGAGGDAFEATVTKATTINCNSVCCKEKKYIDLELDCTCKDTDKMIEALFVDCLIQQAAYSASHLYTERAAAALQKAASICDDNCGC